MKLKKWPTGLWVKRLNRNRERNVISDKYPEKHDLESCAVSTDLGRLGGPFSSVLFGALPKEKVMLGQIASLVVYSVTSLASTIELGTHYLISASCCASSCRSCNTIRYSVTFFG